MQFTVVLPPGAIGNLGPIKQTSEMWRSDELALIVETKSVDPINGEHRQILTDIVVGAGVDPGLFVMPGGMQVIDIAPMSRAVSQQLH